MQIRVGISGWKFPPWRKTFYPEKLVQKKELEYASRKLTSIEINGSFYALQSPETYQKWYSETPDGFVFSLKATQYITHIRRLKDCELPLANFFGSGLLHLKEKLGAILWQLPPNLLFDEERIAKFFSLLPQNFSEAVRISKKADIRDASFPMEAKNSKQKIRHAIEVRHHSFENPYFIDLLRKYNVALVFGDTSGKWPYIEDVTSDFIYVRLHGEEEVYGEGYDDKQLQFWRERLQIWQSGKQPEDALTLTDKVALLQKRPVFVYFDNDNKTRAPADALRLISILNT